MKNRRLILLLFTLFVLILLFVSGCFYARLDWEPDRKSATVWTIGKHVVVDSNGYNSDPDNVDLLTPWGKMGTGE